MVNIVLGVTLFVGCRPEVLLRVDFLDQSVKEPLGPVSNIRLRPPAQCNWQQGHSTAPEARVHLRIVPQQPRDLPPLEGEQQLDNDCKFIKLIFNINF